MLANLELLQASLDHAGDDEDRAATASALRSSRRMSRLVSDLLLLARADAGRAGARARLRPDRDRRRGGRRGRAGRRRPRDRHRLGGAGDRRGNPDELHRMVLNLLDNAIIHTPSGTDPRPASRATAARRLLERLRRRPRDPGRAARAGLRALRPRRGARRPGPRRGNGARPGDRPRRRRGPRRLGRGRQLAARRRALRGPDPLRSRCAAAVGGAGLAAPRGW